MSSPTLQPSLRARRMQSAVGGESSTRPAAPAKQLHASSQQQTQQRSVLGAPPVKQPAALGGGGGGGKHASTAPRRVLADITNQAGGSGTGGAGGKPGAAGAVNKPSAPRAAPLGTKNTLVASLHPLPRVAPSPPAKQIAPITLDLKHRPPRRSQPCPPSLLSTPPPPTSTAGFLTRARFRPRWRRTSAAAVLEQARECGATRSWRRPVDWCTRCRGGNGGCRWITRDQRRPSHGRRMRVRENSCSNSRAAASQRRGQLLTFSLSCSLSLRSPLLVCRFEIAAACRRRRGSVRHRRLRPAVLSHSGALLRLLVCPGLPSVCVSLSALVCSPLCAAAAAAVAALLLPSLTVRDSPQLLPLALPSSPCAACTLCRCCVLFPSAHTIESAFELSSFSVCFSANIEMRCMRFERKLRRTLTSGSGR